MILPTIAHFQPMDRAPKDGRRILVAIKSAFDGKARVEIRRWESQAHYVRPRP